MPQSFDKEAVAPLLRAPAVQGGRVDALKNLPSMWRKIEQSSETQTDFDKGYEQASYECADALEAALAQNAQVEVVADVKRGDRHAGCGGFWCDVVEAEYKQPPRVTLDESSVERYVKLGLMCDECGAELPSQAPRARVPDGLLDHLREAARRIESGHSPRRIPAEPGDVDLALTEAIAWLEGRPAPFWIKPAAAAAPSQPEDAESDVLARRLYTKWADDQGIHCNRMPGWLELSDAERNEWRTKATTKPEDAA